MDFNTSTINATPEGAKASESLAYPLNYSVSNRDPEATKKVMDGHKKDRKMILMCKACGANFDSTFSVEEFSLLAEDQNRSGTLHLCPNCGNLSIYELKDYQEPT
jgi:hypothetical protein